VYEEYWGLDRAPFQNVPNPTFFCPIPAHGEILEKLVYVVRGGKGGALLTGEVGCGKSTLSRVFLLQLEEEKYDIGLVINPSFPADELLCEIARQLGVSADAPHRPTLFRSLTDRLVANDQAGRATLLVLDEAHTIRDPAVFEDLRMLLNVQLNDRYLLTVIFLGLPELKENLARHRSLDQRLPIRLNLTPLNEAETAFYIGFRLKKAGVARQIFTAEAITSIHEAAGGIPRSINNLCDLCLLEGWRRRAREIGPTLVEIAAAFT
jgi:general secretion pathway protein A